MPDSLWTREELAASVKAYLWIAEQQMHGRPVTKVEVYRSLRDGALRARTLKSIERRMGNISKVMVDLGRPRARGFVPSANVGANVAGMIAEIIEEHDTPSPPDTQPTDDMAELQKRVEQLLKGRLERPAGRSMPQRATRESESFFRDPVVKAWVLQEAAGTCEACLQPAPFTSKAGFPFLEVHHLRMLASGGSDTVENAVAVCPNCHRRLHHSGDSNLLRAAIYQRLSRLREE
jgi:5-methylcytosine-specific restriction protein A